MGIFDYGNQTVSFDYKELGKSENFNRINYKLIEKGIYTGGLLTRVDDTHVNLSTLLCYIEDNSTGLGVRLSTADVLNIEVSSTVPYIIIRYVWSNTENNYADIIPSTYANLLPDDIIIGRCVFAGSVLDTSFDYSRRDDALLAINQIKKDYLKVVSNEPYNTQVYVYGGTFYTKQKIVTVSAGNSPVISNTTLGRTDLIYINDSGTILVEEGVDSGSPVTPNHLSRTVIAEIHRGASATYITGKDIIAVDYLNTTGIQDINIDSKSVDYTISDYDDINVINMTTGAADKTVTLPTAADNTNREIVLIKADGGVGKAILDGEGSETINGTLTWEITEQWGRVKVKCDGSNWIVLESEGSIIKMIDTTQRSQSNPTANTWYNLNNNSITIPAGIWEVNYSVTAVGDQSTPSAYWIHATLSTGVSSETDIDLSVASYTGGGTLDQGNTFFRQKRIVLGSSTVYYFNIKTTDSNLNSITEFNNVVALIIRAQRVG